MAAGNNFLPYPIYGAPYRVIFPILDADGDPVANCAADTPDSEVSLDCANFADCTNELTEIETDSGVYYLDLTAAEMTADVVAVICKTATAGTKTTSIVLYPQRLAVICTGTASAGAEGSITLASPSEDRNFNDYYNGMFVQATNNDPAGIQGQTRVITDYAEVTRIATVAPNWATTPTSATTYTVLGPTPGVAAALENLTVALKDLAITADVYDSSTAFPIVSADSGATLIARVGAEMALVNDAIAAAKFDETTAFPLAAADSAATQIARVGADGDTLETLSDQIDGVTAATAAAIADAVLEESIDDHKAVAASLAEHIDALLTDTDELQDDWLYRDALAYGMDTTEDLDGEIELLLDGATKYTAEVAGDQLFAKTAITAGATATVGDVVKAIYSGARGKIVKTGDAYAFYDDDDTAVLFTLTIAAGARTTA